MKFQKDPLKQLLLDSMPENDIDSEWTSNNRLGRFSPKNRKLRPVLIGFPSIEDKHKFLQLSEQMRQSGLRLTERQQHKRDTLNADF